MTNETIIWIHGDCLSPEGPALQAYQNTPAIWVWDDALLDEWQLSLKRIVFIYESLVELPVVIRRGDVAAELRQFAQQHGAHRIATAESPSPRFAAICDELRQTHTVEALPVAPFLAYSGKLKLGRFWHYWRIAERYVFDKTGPRL